MNEIFILPKDELDGGLYRRIYLLVRKDRWSWQSAGATFGIAGGMLSIILGLWLWALVQFLAPVGFGSSLHLLSNIFLVIPLPLLAWGAYCLDLLEKRPPTLPLPAKSQVTVSERRTAP